MLSGPFPPTLFPSFFPPLSPAGPVPSLAPFSLFTSPFIPPFFDFVGTGQASIIILSAKNALLPPRPQDEKTYPEVVSRSMPRILKDFCQCACSQKIRRAPLEKKYGPHKSAVSVPSVSFSRDSTVYVPSVKFVVGPVLRFLYRPYFLFLNPPSPQKF